MIVQATEREALVSMTGYPSIDKPWLRFYSREAIESELTNTCMYQYLFDANREHTADTAITISMLMSPEFVYDWYALGRINAISNLIDPRTSVDGIRHYLEEAESQFVLSTDLFSGKIKKAIY